MFKKSMTCALAITSIVWAGHGSALALPEGIYQLENHPNGNVAPPLYGLRLDELIDVTVGQDYFTFDFEHPQSDMRIDITATDIRIFGNAYGGLIDNPNDTYAGSHVGLWEIDFTYSSYALAVGDDDRLTQDAGPADHWGTIAKLFDNNDSFLLQDKSDGNFSFRLGDEDDDLGHRGFDGISGWGWLNHAPGDIGPPSVEYTHYTASDWLFTVGDPIPEPASLALLGAGSLLFFRRQR